MNSSVLSIPVFGVHVLPVGQAMMSLGPYCDEPSGPVLAEVLSGGVANPNLGKRFELTFHQFERLTSLDDLLGSIRENGYEPADPDIMFSLLFAFSGEAAKRERRTMMGMGKTLICLPDTPVEGTGPVQIQIGQNQCERVRGQRPWAIRKTVRLARIPALHVVPIVKRF